MKDKLLFYTAYQEFYRMASASNAFQLYCKKAFGEDFSQDGFSDAHQLNKILGMVELDADACVLDIGCGNGKMLEYVQNKTGASIYGFDYAETAIESAVQRIGANGNFQVACIGEIEYPKEKFDLILSMDTMYFAPDMSAFVAQLYSWLKPHGSFICGYQEGDIMAKTANCNTTTLAKALILNGMVYTATDYTKETYELLKQKRKAILSMRNEFKKEGNDLWYWVIKHQTRSVLVPFSRYKQANARYIYKTTK